MSRHEKLLKKLLLKPKDFTYTELQTLLKALGYVELKRGRTSGSRVAFMHSETQHIVRLHKPHPSSILKRYQLDYIEEELRYMGVIK
ncbi:MAG: type II toxin-antitoxin system HicA family toxin [Spirochaetota bacterium]